MGGAVAAPTDSLAAGNLLPAPDSPQDPTGRPEREIDVPRMIRGLEEVRLAVFLYPQTNPSLFPPRGVTSGKSTGKGQSLWDEGG